MKVKWNSIDNERLIHGTKTMLAVVIGLLLASVMSLPYAQWTIATIFFVMCAQIYVGGVVQKSYLRFLGTLCGCIIAVITIEFFHSTPLSIFLVLAVAAFVFGYIATSGKEPLSYFSTMGGVSVALILLGESNPSFKFALARCIEISAGILIATVVSQFVFPIHAKTHLRQNQADTLEQLRDFYNKTIVMGLANVQTPNHHNLDEEISRSLVKQRQLAKESGREFWGTTFSKSHFAQSLFIERQLLRAIIFMHFAQEKLHNTELPAKLNQLLKKFHVEVLAAFHEEVLAALDVMKGSPEQHPSFKLPSLEAIEKLRFHDKDMIDPEHILYLDALLFNAEIIVDSIDALAHLYMKSEI